jgi:hypothetical protein
MFMIMASFKSLPYQGAFKTQWQWQLAASWMIELQFQLVQLARAVFLLQVVKLETPAWFRVVLGCWRWR